MFRNDNPSKVKFVRTKLKNPNKRDPGNYKYENNLSQIFQIISAENEFTDSHKSKSYNINFDFYLHSQCVIH